MAENITIARPYAKAVFMLAKETPKEIPLWEDFLATLSTLVNTAEARSFLTRPEVAQGQKTVFLVELLTDCLKRKLRQQEHNFIVCMLELKRLAVISEICAEFSAYVLLDQQVIKAEMISAFAVTDKEEQMFLEALKKRFKKEVKLSVSVDPSLLGGAIIKTGDLVIDGSVKGRLEKIALAML